MGESFAPHEKKEKNKEKSNAFHFTFTAESQPRRIPGDDVSVNSIGSARTCRAFSSPSSRHAVAVFVVPAASFLSRTVRSTGKAMPRYGIIGAEGEARSLY